jgi:hypothetical protein
MLPKNTVDDEVYQQVAAGLAGRRRGMLHGKRFPLSAESSPRSTGSQCSGGAAGLDIANQSQNRWEKLDTDSWH